MVVFRILLSYYFVISLDGSSSLIQLISNANSQLINTRRNEMAKFMTVPRTSTWSTMGRSIRVAQSLGLMNLLMKNQPPLISSFTLSVSMDIIIVTLVLISSKSLTIKEKHWRKKQKTVFCAKLKGTSLFDCDSPFFFLEKETTISKSFVFTACLFICSSFVFILFHSARTCFHYSYSL